MVNQLGKPTYFPTLLCVDLRRDLVNICLFNVGNRNTRKRCKTCSQLTTKTPQRRQ